MKGVSKKHTEVSKQEAVRYFVLFGITGDLAKQKIIPALFELWQKKEFGTDTVEFVAFGRKSFSTTEFIDFITKCLGKIKVTEKEKKAFATSWTYIQSELSDSKGYKNLKKKLANKFAPIVYISLPPQLHLQVCDNIIKQKIVTKKNAAKLMLEKPYGYDAKSATMLEKKLILSLRQDQILRVDHYAGKQALIEFENQARQGVIPFELSAKSVQKITFNFLETNDVAERGAFYDKVGALRDVFQNHLLHEFASITAFPFYNQTIDASERAFLRERSLKQFEIVKKPIFKQYKGYKNTRGVQSDSTTETYFKIEARMKSKYWQGVRFIFEGGKAQLVADSSIKIYFKKTARKSVNINPYVIHMNGYGEDAYVRVLRDAFVYDENRFISFEQARLGWKIVEQIEDNK